MEDKDLLDVYSAVSSFKGTENLFLDEEDFVEQINNNPDDVYEAISSFEGTTNLFLDKEDFYTQTGLKKNESQKQQQPQNEAITEGSQTVAEPLQESGGENKYTVNDTAVTRDDILNNLDNEDFIEKVKKGEFNISVQGDVELQSKLSEKFKPPKYQKEFKEQDFFDGEFGAALKALDTATPFGIGEFIDDMGRAISGGQKQGAIVDDALYLMASGGDASEEKIQDYIDAVEVTQSQQTSDAMYNFQKELEEKAAKNESGEPDFFDVFSSLNMGVVPEIIVSSLSAMVNPSSLAAGGTVVGGAAAGGAIAGGGVGAIPAAIASTPYAMAAAGTTLETAVTFSDLIQEELAKEQKEFNKDNVKTLLEDTKKLNSMRSKAAGRGITIGVIDALTGKLGGSVGAKITSKTFRASKPLGVATASAIEAVGGSGGEAAGQLVAGQKFSPQEIVLEGIGEVGQAPINVAAALAKGNTQEKVQAVKDINEKVKKAAKVTGKPLYEMNGEPVSKEELNEIIESANVDDLEGMNVVVENDNEMTSKVESVMQLGVTKKKVMQANPNLDEDNVNKITKLQVELDNLKENDTEVANDRKKQLKESINEIINSQERTTVEQYGDKKEVVIEDSKKESFDDFRSRVYSEEYDKVDGYINKMNKNILLRARYEGVDIQDPVLASDFMEPSNTSMIPIDEIYEYKGEDRIGKDKMTDSRERIDKLKKDIKDNGLKEPLILSYENGDASIIEGNHRIEALKELGYKFIPVEIRTQPIPKNVKTKETPIFAKQQRGSYTFEDVGITNSKIQEGDKKKVDSKRTEDKVEKDKDVGTLSSIQEKYPDVTLDVFESKKSGTISLGKIEVPEAQRGEGIATNVMGDLIDYADANGLKITLTPSNEFGASKARLKEFYKRFGFIDNKGKNRDFSHKDDMYRNPEVVVSESKETADGKKEIIEVKSGTHTSLNPIKIFKGLGGKLDLNGMRINAHKGVNGVFTAVDEDLAKEYAKDKGVSEIILPEGTTFEVIEVDGVGMTPSQYRAAEVKAINNSKADVVKLITVDGKIKAGTKKQEQYIIKNSELINELKSKQASKQNQESSGAKKPQQKQSTVKTATAETKQSNQEKQNVKTEEGKKAEEIKAGDTVNATVDVYESGKKVSKRFKVDVTSVNEDGTFNLKRGKLIYKNIKPNKIAKINPRNVTSINKETEGLTEKDRTKQGVDELVQSYKQKIKDTKEKLQSMLSDVKATSRDKQKALMDAGKAVSDFIKEAVPRGAKIPKSLVQYAARATTPKAVENVTQKIEDYINRSFVSEKKKSIIGKQKNIAKRLRGTSEYTNKEVAVQNLLASLNVSSIEDVALLEEIEAVLKDIENTPIAKVRDNQINDLTDRVSKYEPPKPKVKESISDLESKVNDAELTIRQRYLALNKLVNALNEKREASEDIMDEDVLALESKIEALSERLSEDLKEDIQETNKDTKELLKSVDTSDMSEQQKNMVNELKKAPISNDFKRSKQLNDIAIELSFGYAPIKKMQEYITSAKSEANSSATVDLIDKQATKRKTPFQEFISKSWGKYVIPKVFRIKGISNKSLRDTISDLRLEASDRWDDYFGLGKIKPIQKYVISPIETSITKMNEAVSKSVKDLFNQGIIDKYSQRKIIMAVTQAYWDKYKTGENYWKDLIDNKTFRTNFPARYKELVNDFKGIEKNAEGKVDYNKILSNLKGKEKKVYDWIVKNNEKLLDKQRIANERRGQKFEPIDSRYYIPMKRKSDGLSIQGDDTFVDNLYSMFKDGATKLKSDRGEVRSSGKIQDINMDLYSLVADQIYQTNRDFYVTESVRQSVKTMSKIASRIQDEDAKKFATAMVNATKSRLGREFGSKPDGSVAIVNKVFSWLYQYVLMGPRLAPELVAETTRMSGAADIRMQPKALRLRASLGAVSEIMSFTGSPFLSNLYFENLDYISRRSFNKSAFGRFSEGVSSVNQKILSMPDTLTFNIVWIPSFLKEFKKVSGKEFNISEFNKNREGYLNSNEEFIKEASAFADSETQSVKGSKTRFSQREAVRILPEVVVRGIEAITGKKYGYADAQSVMGKLVTTLQNFAFLEQLNIGNNIREGIYAENKSRSRASSELVTAVASGTAYTYLASALYNYANLLIAENITGDDEDKEKAMDALQKLSSVDAVVDAAMSNALFLSTGKYGNVGKTGVLIILGLYDKYLKNTLPKDEYKKQREELIAMTRGRYFAEPIDLGGYKSESDILNALAPFIGRTLSIVGESVSGVVEGGSKILNGNSNEYVAMKLMNDIIKLLMITTGAPLPFQKDIDKMLKAKVKSMPNQNEKPKSRTINPNNTND